MLSAIVTANAVAAAAEPRRAASPGIDWAGLLDAATCTQARRELQLARRLRLASALMAVFAAQA